jgi:predicted PurR-regulated permease PerM
VVVLVALGLTAAFLQSVVPALVDQFQAMVRDSPHYMANLQHRSASFRQITDRFHLTTQANSLLARLPGELGGGAVGFTRRTFSTLASAVLVAVLTIYFLADLPRLQRGAVLLFPRAHRDRFARIAGVMVDKVGSYMIGNILISLIAGVAAFAALTALGVPFAVPLAFLVAVTDLIPLIGATLGAVICIAVALFATRLWPTTVLVLVFFVVYQQIENYLIAPRIMRGRAGPAQRRRGAAGRPDRAAAMGLIGALMAIPIAAGIRVLLSERLQARDTADIGAATPGDGETATGPMTPHPADGRTDA